ncbi:MAG: phosphotransferase [Myxococcales bacterium]|nr:phosphotransferase [Myxococcales bacterium]MCB9627736.1 phosphotransferase [Sandaracinaceae bacterium]
MSAPPDHTTPVRDAHRFDETALEAWLNEHVDAFDGPLTLRQFRGGQSNPTFWLTDGKRAFVLRKQPPGKLLPSAHAVDREYRVMRALRDTDVPVAEMHALCTDPGVIGTSFYVMEHIEGRIFFDVRLKDVSRAERVVMYEQLADVLAKIHSVDVDAVGLGDFGKQGEYVARQVSRWTTQYRASETSVIETMEKLLAYLPAHVPSDDRTTLAHGDYRLDNLIFHPSEPRVLAVIDWELSTLGHPLADLAYTCMLYDVAMPKVGGLLGVDFAATGIPTEAEFVRRYLATVGGEPSADWAYFKAFSLFRLAAIAQGVYRRSQLGNASSENAAMFGAAVSALSAAGCRLLGL